MNKLFCIIIIVAMLLQVSRKTIVTIQWSINQDYIAKNLCINKNKPALKCDGKCHLRKELKKTEETNENNGKSTVPSFQDDLVLFNNSFVPQIFEHESFLLNQIESKNYFTASFHMLNCGASIWHPPSILLI